MTQKSYQDWCVDTLHRIVNAQKDYFGVLNDQGYKYTLKSIISHYASMYRVGNGVIDLPNGKQHVNLWWDHLRETNFEKFFSPLLVSDAASSLMKGGFRKNLKDDIRIEHITPNGYIYDKLMELANRRCKIERDEIAALFRQSKLVVLAKEDECETCLDGAGARFDDTDVEALRRYYPKETELIADAVALVHGKKSPKSNGSGLLRLCRLVEHGSSFRHKGKKVEPRGLLTYLEDQNYVIG